MSSLNSPSLRYYELSQLSVSLLLWAPSPLLSPLLWAPSTLHLFIATCKLLQLSVFQLLQYYCSSLNNPSLLYYELPQLSVSPLLWAASTLCLFTTMSSVNSPSLRYFELPQLSVSPLLWAPSTLCLSAILWAPSTLRLSVTNSSLKSQQKMVLAV